ncbi:hypothetical protein K4F52_001755 [Lecanicillium sp. MT-2017a]|nr:hypothetical protein K4F52_001755 [Lecanicillium sp. MT-2017a]
MPNPYRLLNANRLPPFKLLIAILAFAATTMFLLYTLVGGLGFATRCTVNAACYHSYHSPFSFDAHLSYQPRWMSQIRDDVPLTSLSVPGTHDTMTYGLLATNEVLQCQNWNISTQLDAGMRYFDIRARLRTDDDSLHIYHGDGDTGFGYQDVLLAMFDFLAANPSEAIVMRLKQEGKPVGSAPAVRSFEEAFNFYWHNSSITAKQAEEHIHVFDAAAPLPTLGDLRSKIFILQNFPSERGPTEYGIEWEGDQMVLEDLYSIPDVYHLKDKWAAIHEALVRAATDKQDNKAMYLAHISASVGVLPIEAAAGPLNRTVVGMNDQTGWYLEDGAEEGGRTGVVIFDFPGKRAIDAVLERNKNL